MSNSAFEMDDMVSVLLREDELEYLINAVYDRIEEDFIDLQDAVDFLESDLFDNANVESKDFEEMNCNKLSEEIRKYIFILKRLSNKYTDDVYEWLDRVDKLEKRFL